MGLFGSSPTNYRIDIMAGSSGTVSSAKTFEEASAKAYEAKNRPNVTKVTVSKDGKVLLRL